MFVKTMTQGQGTDAPRRPKGAQNGAVEDKVRFLHFRDARSAFTSRQHLSRLQLVREFVGYTGRAWTVAIYRFLVLATGGLLWLLGRYSLSARLWSLQACSLRQADLVLVKVSCAMPESISDCTLITQCS